MSANTQFGLKLGRAVAIACVLALLISAGVWYAFSAAEGKKITAYFTGAVGVYPGGTVRVLGVQVGTIDEVDPGPANVKVQMSVDPTVKIPANASAVVVLPSVVSDRYIQLPVYHSGPQLSGGAVIAASNTRTPTEIDNVYRTLNQLATTLGPNGANKNGAVSDLLNTGAANLEGNGQNIKDTLNQLGKAAGTLNDNKQDLFGTVQNLAKFTTTLQRSDAQVQDLSGKITDVTQFLNSERSNLSTSVHDLGGSLARVKAFIEQNRGALKSNVDNLTKVTKTVADNRGPLAETLDTAPLALNNLVNAYDAASGTLDARPALQELTDPPIVAICKMVQNFDHSPLPQALGSVCGQLAKVVQGILPIPPLTDLLAALQRGQLPTLPAPLVNVMNGGAR